MSEEELYRLGKEIRARQTFVVSALTGKNVRYLTTVTLLIMLIGQTYAQYAVPFSPERSSGTSTLTLNNAGRPDLYRLRPHIRSPPHS